ncbi:hypothetical protein BDQ17DRAFT_1539302 [Cyathus striatus]|nr:hypothetical protein BDQ17DRAFT_1539302 [Cyathus striatus]
MVVQVKERTTPLSSFPCPASSLLFPMPRLLPRILHKIAQEKDHPKYFPFKNPQSPVSRYKPLPPRPSFQPADYPTSILFSPAPNPVTNPREYVIRKSLPPVKCLHHDTPREMTDDERAWWSSPYLRMLASPMRHCFVTQRHLPAVRLGAVRVPGTSRPQTTLIPDGLQHTKFAARQSPSAVHVSCHRKVILQLLNRGGIQRIAPNAQLYPNLPDYIADMLHLVTIPKTARVPFTSPINKARMGGHQRQWNNDGTLPPPDKLPNSRVPLYNGATMFPNPEQRAYLYCSSVEHLPGKLGNASHTFLLSSDQEIVKFGDITAAAVALWRVRMYEGGGWDQENTWALDPPKHAWRSERYKLGSDTVGSS